MHRGSAVGVKRLDGPPRHACSIVPCAPPAEAPFPGAAPRMQGGYDFKALGDSVCDSMRGALGLASADRFNPQLLREEPLDKVQASLAEARRIHGL